jgi:hypothetical protein
MHALILVLASLALLVVSPAMAAVIYDNQAGTPNFGQFSDPSLQFIADDFTLLPGQNTIRDVHWTGAYIIPNSAPSTDNFTIEFYVDLGTVPALFPIVIRTVGNAVTRVDTGTDVLGSDVFAYSTDIAPVTLTPNVRFWISIFNDTPNADDGSAPLWLWAGSVDGGNPFAFRTSPDSPWTASEGVRLDFALTDSAAVPEPATFLVLVFGAGLLAIARRLSSTVGNI